ncbi:PDZ domain-containing protein [Edaphobacter albus]|uniref:PDZ domain-containing protein n=1 Tax=Edaphobacter sp. 4G125 TaxID=2763071 RepID=UPI001647E8C3|nr:PDZ domain-containing protein [Edaphobacter sp. 4G125]QNI36930.1 PDZ domain-containing protein [Edaphobacter sp. 4G125]
MSHAKSFSVLVLAAGVVLLNGASSLAQPGPLHTSAMLRVVGLSGKNSQGYLGVDLKDISEDQVSALKLKDTHGAEIVGVDHDAPACKDGLELHDVILQMNGQAIDGETQLRRMLREMPAGRTVTFLISRDGQQHTIQTHLANREEVEREAWEKHYTVPEPSNSSSADVSHPGNSFLAPSKSTSVKGTHTFLGTTVLVSSSYTGAKLEVMGPQLAEFFGVQGGTGLLVRNVEPSSPAADAGLKAGDVVVKLNALPIASGNDWSKTIHENRGKTVNVVILRDRKKQTLTLTPDTKRRSAVTPWTSLEGYFGDSDQAQQTRAMLAELQPVFDAMAARMRQQLEDVRFNPETAQMIARLNAWSHYPDFQRQMNQTRRQVMAAAEAARHQLNPPVVRDRVSTLHQQIQHMVRLD